MLVLPVPRDLNWKLRACAEYAVPDQDVECLDLGATFKFAAMIVDDRDDVPERRVDQQLALPCVPFSCFVEAIEITNSPVVHRNQPP